ncbi:FHA domain-containing protein [Urbifossiella limnaea]|uniref:FHA domain protein n=1 Tax=Urbifossiella limnaea TaxID=2528023 RepID=A0A517XLB1_9BACT|nr:FHA domain-containing protein [Urbifossiella limnaea]QDU18290.1 FHA domain protein [Urbifossiella limnaea]
MAELPMKVSLVVASGVHQGKAIPIVGAQFVIGRDPACQLRPASQAVSKQHCAVLVRDGKVFVRDMGSTNGTQLNDATLKGEEREVRPNDNLRVGPLDFTVRIEPTVAREDGTPLPERSPETAAAMAAVQAATAAAAASPGPAARNATPNPARKAGTGAAPALTGSKEQKALSAAAAELDEHDRLAAMLLGMDDGPAEVPGGSTVVDMPATALTGDPAAAKAAEKKPDVAKVDTADAASDLLRRYMRRPK